MQELLVVGKLVLDGAGPALREQRRSLHGQQVLFDHPPYEVVDLCAGRTPCVLQLEPVRVEQGQEELKVTRARDGPWVCQGSYRGP